MAKIYISSTFEDLKVYRQSVSDVLKQLGHEVIAMEDYVASDKRPLQKCLTDVASCNIYIGLFAWRYGYIPPNNEKSITELEYQEATLNNIERLIFILDETASWPPNFIDTDRTLIEQFKKQLMTDHTVSKFKSPEELKSCVSISMQHVQKENHATCQQPLITKVDNAILKALPYYVNRTNQLSDMWHKRENTLKKHTFWIIPGAINQCHYDFLECFEKWHWKEKSYCSPNKPPKLINFVLPKTVQKLDGYIFDQLWSKYRSEKDYNESHKTECIDTLYFSNQNHSIVLYTTISSEAWKHGISDLITGLLEFIDQFPKRKNGLFLCVLLTYSVGSFFKNRLKKKILKTIQKQHSQLLIEELGNVEELDVKNWLNCELVKKFCGHYDSVCISEIYTSYQNNSIPMELLTRELRDRFIDKRK
ncbi:MAG: DUF4062 domain-containing protein [Candidatus Magnetomorum sp.]|nr:DUF4062 domain-containing protein [Candidatus Magnetomorum sp.]